MNHTTEFAVRPTLSGLGHQNVQRTPPVRRLANGGRGAQTAGFTLVELMIVVTIVGILATMAVVGYRKLVSSSHMSEATHMVNAIRVAQEAYRAESGTYLDVSAAIASNQNVAHGSLYPHCAAVAGKEPGNYKVGWGGACTAACCNTAASARNDWRNLPVHADGAVMFGYSTKTGSAGTSPSSIASGVAIGSTAFSWPSSASADYFVVTAVGDTDGNGSFCTVLGSSLTSDLSVDRDGE